MSCTDTIKHIGGTKTPFQITKQGAFSLVIKHLHTGDFGSLSQTCKEFNEDIQRYDSYIYKECQHTQPHGLVIEQYSSGAVRSSTNYKDGERHGKFSYWREDGSLSEVCMYYFDQEHGMHTHYYRDGSVASYTQKNYGYLHGKTMMFFPDGTTRSSALYKNGVQIGDHTCFYENGVIMSIDTFDGNKTHRLRFYENGNKHIEGHFIDWRRHGDRIEWDVNGDLISVKNYD